MTTMAPMTTMSCYIGLRSVDGFTDVNSSHYWGGQLDTEVQKMGINHTMKTNTESWWYALILQGLSVTNYK